MSFKIYVSVTNKWFSRTVYRDSHGKVVVFQDWVDKPEIPDSHGIKRGTIIEFRVWRSVAFTSSEFNKLLSGTDERFTLDPGDINTAIYDDKIYVSFKDMEINGNVCFK